MLKLNLYNCCAPAAPPAWYSSFMYICLRNTVRGQVQKVLTAVQIAAIRIFVRTVPGYPPTWSLRPVEVSAQHLRVKVNSLIPSEVIKLLIEGNLIRIGRLRIPKESTYNFNYLTWLSALSKCNLTVCTKQMHCENLLYIILLPTIFCYFSSVCLIDHKEQLCLKNAKLECQHNLIHLLRIS